MRNFSLLLLAPLAVACTSMASPTVAPADACSPEALARYTGLAANDALAERMKRETGKTALRLVKPGTAVTMDYREDRLTVYLDAANKVERVSCS
ncbi:MAG: I78 family peptidase inhibitor [Sphingomicrobium sp.]